MAGNLPTSAVQTVVNTAERFQAPGYQVALGGEAIGLVAGAKPGSSEGFGILAAIIIMLLAFGSVVAMSLPIMTAIFGIAVAFAVLDLLSHVVTTPTFAPEIMAMIGLGVGIDYALFVVTRYRAGLSEKRDPRDAVAISLATSGRAVVFAGTTVILSLLGLFLLQLPFMRGLAIGAISAVVLVMLAAVTLLPAMLGFSGRAIDNLRIPATHAEAGPNRSTTWILVPVEPHTSSSSASGRCRLWMPSSLSTSPCRSSRCGWPSPAADDDPASTSTTQQAFDALATGFGPGFNGPLVVAASGPTR